MNMKKRKLSALLALVLALVLALSGCSGGTGGSSSASSKADAPESSKAEAPVSSKAEEPASSAEESEPEAQGTATGGTLRMGAYVLDTQMSNKSPFATSGTFTDMLDILYEPLFTFNEKKGELEPALATEYSWNDGFTELTFTINPDVKWHDGTAFSAEDVACTMQILKDVPTFDQYALWDKLSDVKADGDKVVFTCSQPFTALPRYLTKVKIVPKHIWENEDAENFINETPVGTGPFAWDKYTVGTSVELTAFKDYWNGAPKVDKMLIVLYNTSPNTTLGLLNGEIDCTTGTIAMSSIPEFTSKEFAQMDIYAGLGNFSVLINHENELLSDVAVRKAMAMAINQPELISRGEYNGVLPTSIGWLPDLFGDYVSEEAKNSLAFDLEAAQKVLEDAGYTKGDDGIYQKDGKRLSFTYHNASGAPAQQMEAGMIQQWLLNLGVEIIPKLATWPELTSLAQTGKYDLLQMGINFPPDPYAALNSCFNSSMTAPAGESTPGLNYFRYRSDEMDGLLEQASAETDEEKLKALYYQMQDLLAKDYVFLPMYNSSGHIPYYDGAAVTGWTDYEASVKSNRNLINVRPVG
jgi:peptide/nickel transport system substrate-binding protein